MSDDVLTIAPVCRDSSKIVLVLAGQTGEGKTVSGLLLALGLAGMNPARVGMIDTEGRASLNENVYKALVKGDHRFLNGVLHPPHSPARYALALRQFSRQEIDAIVVDSGSHEHEGFGGMEEIANAPKANGEPRKVADWITAKREHRKFMNTLLSMPCHVIVCLRAREKFDFKNPKEPVSLGLKPICEKNFMFDATSSFMMRDKGRIHEEIKLNDDLRPMLRDAGYFTPEHGLMIREWLGGVDPTERAQNVLRLAAAEGLSQLGVAWGSLDKPMQRKLTEFKDTLKDLAAHADKERMAIKGDNGAPDEEERTW